LGLFVNRYDFSGMSGQQNRVGSISDFLEIFGVAVFVFIKYGDTIGLLSSRDHNLEWAERAGLFHFLVFTTGAGSSKMKR
jgi:hypothetical protein